MDKQQKTPNRQSGIPRLAVSRLPLPTSTASKSIKPSPSREKLRADPGLDAARLRRPSEQSVFKKPLPKYSSSVETPERAQRTKDISQTRTSYGGRSENKKVLDDTPPLETDDVAGYDAETRGRARPSLSERTIETLSSIPPSPASSRKSSFFNGTSPMRSPSRPPSSMTSRSPSRSSSTRQSTGNDFLSSRPPPEIRVPSRSRISAASLLPANNVSTEQKIVAETDSPSKPKKSSLKSNIHGRHKDVTGTMVKSRPALEKTSANSIQSDMAPPPQPLQVKKTRKVPSHSSLNARLSSIGLRSPSDKSSASDLTAERQSEVETRKASKSSSALRESIAKAKAARKASVKQGTSHSTPVDTWENLEAEDPFNQRPKDPNHAVLRKRLQAGRTSGSLNIAAMFLTELPNEVMTMYDFDPDTTTDWYESVDLVKFIAADNEFIELPDAAFPDIDPYELDPESDERGSQFYGLEILDLHGNLLRSLPMGFRRLQRLQTLNLSNNKLDMDSIQVVMEMESLRDLRLANNNLQGSLTPNINNLTNLETLHLHGNSLTDLPECLANLTALKVLNVGDNQLTSLPFESLSKLPLKELSAPRNKLAGTLIPASVHKLETLQNLDVVSNALKRLSEHENLELPSLLTLSISVNRIECLPNVSSWQSLFTLSAEDNCLSECPQGFVGLKMIRNVDLTGNNISKLNERIGLMESLFTFRIANNPLRERKFLNMNTEDIKRNLRNRCEPEPQDTDDDESSVATQFTLAPETPAQLSAWKIKPGGVLDRSYTDMQELEVDKLDQINTNDIRCLYLQHNELRCIPVPALSMLAHNLIELDLSNNALNSSSLLSSPITLPNLQNLNLSSTGLTTLEPILSDLSAPSLTILDVSCNRLSGPLPSVRRSYPNLVTFLAADNRFDSLEFDAVQGLQVLDLGNNSISALPPKLGLLRAEGDSKNWGTGSALRRFEISGNTFRVPRWQVVAKGTDAILEWLKDKIPAKDLAEWEPSEETYLME